MDSKQQIRQIIIASPSLNLLGGAQRACLHAINALKKTECKIRLVTIDKTDWVLVEEIFGETAKPDEEFYLFPRMPKMPAVALKQAFIAVSYAFQLFRITMKNKASLVINMGGEIVDNFGNIVYVNAVPLRLMHLFPGIQPRPGIQWKIYSKLYSLFLILLGGADGTIVANSQFTRGIVEKCLGKRARVINPPVASSRIALEANRRKCEDAIVTIARFRSAKGLEIIPKIARSLKDCEFILVGIVDSDSESCSKELSKEIERLQVQDRVHIFKNKPYSFTLAALSTAKVFLHTQSTEAFGMSIVESMAAGCVPVVPRTGGPWLDILDRQEGVYGFSYKSADEAAGKIRLLIENEGLRSEISARAAERAMIFDSSAFEKKLLTLVRTVSSHSERPR
jgi:glycosyltransferase involved in cell wall biosynthesis